MAKSRDIKDNAPPPLNLEGEGPPPSGEIVDRVPSAISETAPPTEQFPGITLVAIQVPLDVDDSTQYGHIPSRCEVSLVNKEQKVGNVKLRYGEGMTLARLNRALIATQAKLADGRPVKSNNDSLRWILQQLGDEPKRTRKTQRDTAV